MFYSSTRSPSLFCHVLLFNTMRFACRHSSFLLCSTLCSASVHFFLCHSATCFALSLLPLFSLPHLYCGPALNVLRTFVFYNGTLQYCLTHCVVRAAVFLRSRSLFSGPHVWACSTLGFVYFFHFCSALHSHTRSQTRDETRYGSSAVQSSLSGSNAVAYRGYGCVDMPRALHTATRVSAHRSIAH